MSENHETANISVIERAASVASHLSEYFENESFQTVITALAILISDVEETFKKQAEIDSKQFWHDLTSVHQMISKTRNEIEKDDESETTH